MSFRKLPNSSPINLYSRHKHNGLDVDTFIEGSAIDVSSTNQQRSKNTTRDRTIKNTIDESTTKDSNFKEKYVNLQKTMHNLRNDLKVKTKLLYDVEIDHKSLKEKHEKENQKLQTIIENLQREVSNLKKDCTNKEAKFQKNMECYDTTVTSLKNEIRAIKTLHASALSSVTEKHNKEMRLLKKHLEAERSTVLNVFDEELKEKQNTIDKLKIKLAESFTESSKERQIQIKELVKELERVSGEAEYVKTALKNLKTTSDCQRCSFFNEKFKEISKELTEKNNICRSLFMVCSKMEKQLSQQDDLLQVWSDVKKHI